SNAVWSMFSGLKCLPQRVIMPARPIACRLIRLRSGLARRWTRHGLLWRVWPAGDLALAVQAARAALGNCPRRSELSCCGKTTLFREHANYLCTTALLRRGLFSCAADLSACPQFAEMPQ